MLTGNQETMKEGNLKAEKAEWKSSAADGTVPLPSKERLVGKAERRAAPSCMVRVHSLTPLHSIAHSEWSLATSKSKPKAI